MYKIQAAVHHISIDIGPWKLYSFPWKVGHHFWVLTISSGGRDRIVDSIHGFSTHLRQDENGEIHPYIPKLLETWNSKLKVYCIPAPDEMGDAYHVLARHWTQPHETAVKYGEKPDEKDAREKWSHVKCHLSELNDADIKYSFGGVGKWFGFCQCRNSNSAYTTVGLLLDLEPHHFPSYAAPGWRTIMLPETHLATLKARHAGKFLARD